MNVLCFLLRHRWRVESSDGESYEICARCRHYRNDVRWVDVTGANQETGGGQAPGSVGYSSGPATSGNAGFGGVS